MRQYICVACYPGGKIQRKICYIDSCRLYGLKLNRLRPTKVFIPYELKSNKNLLVGIYKAMHPKIRDIRYL